MELIALIFLLISVSVSLLARLETDSAMCDSGCIGRIPAFASSMAFLNCENEIRFKCYESSYVREYRTSLSATTPTSLPMAVTYA